MNLWKNIVLKRALDFIAAFCALIFLLPVFGIIILMVRLKLGSPVFFIQLRPGLNAKLFNMIKFRTMSDARGADGKLLSDDVRLSAFGRFLRSTSLDELPEFWNILKGEMSLVGPRPLLVEYLPLYTPEQAQRHAVRPGVTGWAQVNGRNAIDWDEKFMLDLWYVKNYSLWLDIKIIFMTIKKVLLRDGISADGEVTMAKFKGTQTHE